MSSIHLTKEASAKLLGLPLELYGEEYMALCKAAEEAEKAYQLALDKAEDFRMAAYQAERNRRANQLRAATNPETLKQMGVEL